MVSYRLAFRPEAEQDLHALDETVRERIFDKLKWLVNNFENLRPEPLTASLKGFYKLRVGDYRVIYRIDRENTLLTVYFIGHRREIYKFSA